MLEQLNRFFTAASRIRRSEHAVVRGGALLELQALNAEVYHPKLKGRIAALLSDVVAKSLAS